MISLHRISRLASHASSDSASATLLVEEILGSTRPLPLSVRLRLQVDETLPAVAIGLGLSRFVDLTFAPTAHTEELVEQLLSHQRADGSFGSVSATAVACAALLKASGQLGRGLVADQAFAGRTDAGAEAALAWLSERLTPVSASGWQPIEAIFGGEFEEDGDGVPVFEAEGGGTLACDPIDAAIALWQLAAQPGVRKILRAELILESLERSGARHDRAVAQLLDRASSALSCQQGFAGHSPSVSPSPTLTEAA